jgi:hypothetical protein
MNKTRTTLIGRNVKHLKVHGGDFHNRFAPQRVLPILNSLSLEGI